MYGAPARKRSPVEPGGRPRGAGGERVDMAALHRNYLDAVFNHVRRRVPNQSEAEDITAEVFAAAAAEFCRYRGEGGYYAWLVGIAHRKIVDANRHRNRQPEVLDADLSDDERETLSLLLVEDIGELPEEAVQHAETKHAMRALIEALPQPQREALVLQIYDGLTIKEIAQVIGRSPAAVNSLLERARAAIFRHGRSYFEG